MSATTETKAGRAALMIAHCAGMIDLVALPVWVGTLIADYKFDPPHAGGLVTLFLIGAVLSSLFFASRFNKLNRRLSTTIGFALAAIAFVTASRVSDFATLAALHALAGASAGCSLSFTHGAIARSARPHRMFALVNFALGVFAILFLGATPNLIAAHGGSMLFVVFAAVMAIAALACALAFPAAPRANEESLLAEVGHIIHPTVWFGVAGIACMGLNQAMMFSFLERLGLDHGFTRSAVTGVLIALGFANLIPAPLAAFLETRVSARAVLFFGPLVQALIIVALTFGSGFAAFAAPAMLLAGVMIFTHTFAFGALSRLDRSSRALAGTPAMLMTGAAIGPILGGVLVQGVGYPALGVAAVVLAVCAIVLFGRLHAPATALAPQADPA
jgi:predicted MFS family arabinose efflux permease